MNELDQGILNLLVRVARMTFADIARELGILRAHARHSMQALVDAGVIEQFAAVVNPDRMGRAVSARTCPVAPAVPGRDWASAGCPRRWASAGACARRTR